MPFTRPRSAQVMSQSLLPTLDGLTFGLSILIFEFETSNKEEEKGNNYE